MKGALKGSSVLTPYLLKKPWAVNPKPLFPFLGGSPLPHLVGGPSLLGGGRLLEFSRRNRPRVRRVVTVRREPLPPPCWFYLPARRGRGRPGRRTSNPG